ncbi:unnamed protein product [Caenorhabditis sp. 36 PRJEB53466]|nr:unnamed protein product [Caenorhabditis sp. 36 PRJEB53466]
MIRGFTLLAVVACIAMGIGYVITNGPMSDAGKHHINHHFHKVTIIRAPLEHNSPQLKGDGKDPVTTTEEPSPYFGDVIGDPFGTRDEENLFIQKQRTNKRSMAIGRTGWRPGKRSDKRTPTGKRSTALRRMLWLPSNHGEIIAKSSRILPDKGQPEQVYEDMPHPGKNSNKMGHPLFRPRRRALPISFEFEMGSVFLKDDSKDYSDSSSQSEELIVEVD